VIRVAIVALVVGLVACGGDGLSRGDDGRVTRAQMAGVPELTAGDCFNDPEPDELDSIEQLEVLPCDLAHDNEIYYSFDLADGPMPAADDIFELAASQCLPAFDAFVGIPFELSALDVFPLTPTLAQWDDGHHTIHCVLFNLDLSELAGSARGTAR
jgi:hypothetical protein